MSWAHGQKLITIWGWSTGSWQLCENIRSYKAAWICTKKPLKDLNCQRESSLWRFRKRSKIRLHPSGEWFGCALRVLLSPCSTHRWAAKQERDREKAGMLNFILHSPIPNYQFTLAYLAIQATSLFSNSWPLSACQAGFPSSLSSAGRCMCMCLTVQCGWLRCLFKPL